MDSEEKRERIKLLMDYLFMEFNLDNINFMGINIGNIGKKEVLKGLSGVPSEQLDRVVNNSVKILTKELK